MNSITPREQMRYNWRVLMRSMRVAFRSLTGMFRALMQMVMPRGADGKIDYNALFLWAALLLQTIAITISGWMLTNIIDIRDRVARLETRMDMQSQRVSTTAFIEPPSNTPNEN